MKKIVIITIVLIMVAFVKETTAQDAEFDTLKFSGATVALKLPPKPVMEKDEIESIKTSVASESDSLFKELQNQEFISDNVVSEVDIDVIEEAQGSALKITYSYSLKVDTLMFQTDDFSLGNYNVESSHAVMVTLMIMKKTIEEQLYEYITPGKRIDFNIIGSADSSPIKGMIAYRGEFGSRLNNTYIIEGKESSMNIAQWEGIRTNEELAFVRSYSVRNYIEKNIQAFQNTNNSFKHFAVVSSERGGKYRRVSIEMLIHQAFNN
ncbi:MAG: hypothetical protein PF436_08020 [Prolixibacteraceae bacterium]|jgi:hypothetical protein|nr:hypothetical protein [Prolixibacteraceae bacterium]